MKLLDKHIHKFPIIKIPKSLLSFSENTAISQTDLARQYPHLCETIVIFNDFKPLSNWFDLLNDVYVSKWKRGAGKMISVRMLQYTDLKICIIRERSPWVYAKKSSIPNVGKGLFATRNIPKDTVVCVLIQHINEKSFMYDDEGYLMNHSKKLKNIKQVFKKTRQGCKTLFAVAIRNIHANEELFIDYTLMKRHYPEWSELTFIDKS
jgi:hypothetical protein